MFHNMKNWIKRLLAPLSELIPFGRGLYIKYIDSGASMSYRGVFSSFHEASQAVCQGGQAEYDILNRNKVEKVKQGLEDLDNWFQVEDYPFLFWVSQLVQRSNQLLELGGSLGHFYYSSQRYTSYAVDFNWTIAELPEAVALGKQIASQRNETRLNFIESSGLDDAPAVDLLITAGTIQYMPDDFSTILTSLKKLPRHVLVHRLPVLEGNSCWTLQNLVLCEVPYRLYGEQALFNGLRRLGYKIVAGWEHPRLVNIPFHSKHQVKKYIGFYCCLD